MASTATGRGPQKNRKSTYEAAMLQPLPKKCHFGLKSSARLPGCRGKSSMFAWSGFALETLLRPTSHTVCFAISDERRFPRRGWSHALEGLQQYASEINILLQDWTNHRLSPTTHSFLCCFLPPDSSHLHQHWGVFDEASFPSILILVHSKSCNSHKYMRALLGRSRF